jgi:hypothetical protein
LLDPGVDEPAPIAFFGGSNLAAGQSGAEVEEDAARVFAIVYGFACRELFDGRLQGRCDACLRGFLLQACPLILAARGRIQLHHLAADGLVFGLNHFEFSGADRIVHDLAVG